MTKQDDKCCIVGCDAKAKVIVGESGDPYTEWRVCATHADSFDAVFVADIEAHVKAKEGKETKQW